MKPLIFESKVQEIGKNRDGKPRYMIYISKAVNFLKLTKGQKIKYCILEETDIESGKTIKYEPTENGTVEKKLKNDFSSMNLTEEETDFLSRYKDADTQGLKDFIAAQANIQFTEKRVNELLEIFNKLNEKPKLNDIL